MNGALKWIRRGLQALLILALGTAFAAVALVTWTVIKYDIGILSVQTGSMAPAIKPGDVVVGQPVDLDQLNPGDVVTYQASSGNLITHRVKAISRSGNKVETKGDANTQSDGFVSAGQIRSRPLFILPSLGHWLSQLRRPVVIMLVVYLPATIIISREVQRLQTVRHGPYRLRGYV